ncbi:hypothetical protein ACVWXO_011113 [Bradyrhizobium sp. LM2.7]
MIFRTVIILWKMLASTRLERTPIGRRTGYTEDRSGLEAKPKERLMPRTLQERLDQVEREIELYLEFDRAEKVRLNRESYLWAAEDRIEWQEMQSANAQRVRELLEERDALRSQLGL